MQKTCLQVVSIQKVVNILNRIEVGKRLRQLRQDHGYDYFYVCDNVGISRSALCMYECGYRIPRDEIKMKLSKLYGVSVESLFFARDGYKG